MKLSIAFQWKQDYITRPAICSDITCLQKACVEHFRCDLNKLCELLELLTWHGNVSESLKSPPSEALPF